MSYRQLSIGVLVAGLIGTAAMAGESLKIVNNSSKTVYHLYLSDADDNEWGPDQLGDSADDTVQPGETFTLTSIEQGSYDVKLVTKSGSECEVDDVAFDSSYEWTITNAMLHNC